LPTSCVLSWLAALSKVLILAREELVAALLGLLVELRGSQPRILGRQESVEGAIDANRSRQLQSIVITPPATRPCLTPSGILAPCPFSSVDSACTQRCGNSPHVMAPSRSHFRLIPILLVKCSKPEPSGAYSSFNAPQKTQTPLIGGRFCHQVLSVLGSGGSCPLSVSRSSYPRLP